MQAGAERQAARQQKAPVLQIALAPAPVADEDVGQGRGGFFEAAIEVGIHPDAPAGPAQQGGFDEIMAQDGAAEGRYAAQCWKVRRCGEGLCANDRIVAPEIAGPAVPGGEPVTENRPVAAVGELLQPGVKALCPDDRRKALKEAQPRIVLQAAGHFYDGFRGHQAVGIENQYGVVPAAPACDPVGNVAGLAFGILAAMAIIDGAAIIGLGDQGGKNGLFGYPGVGRVAVAQDENMETAGCAFLKTVRHGRKRRRHRRGRLIIDGD